MVARQEKEQRLASEIKLKHVMEAEREAKAKEADDYRLYLLAQMEERRQKQLSDNLKSNVFLHHRMLSDNEKANGLNDALHAKLDINAN